MMRFFVGWVRRNAVTHHLGYIDAAIYYQWLRLHRLVGILPRSVPVGYAVTYICSKMSIAARLTHPTNRLISGQLRLPEAEAALAEVV